MGGIIDKITDFIKEMLQGWVLDNLGTMFTDVNDKVGTIAGEVSKTPSTWKIRHIQHGKDAVGECGNPHSRADYQFRADL